MKVRVSSRVGRTGRDIVVGLGVESYEIKSCRERYINDASPEINQTRT